MHPVHFAMQTRPKRKSKEIQRDERTKQRTVGTESKRSKGQIEQYEEETYNIPL